MITGVSKSQLSMDVWNDAATLVGPKELAALYEASATLLRSIDLRQTHESIVLSARYLFGFDRAGLWMYDEDADCIRGTAGTDRKMQLIREDHIAIPFDHVPVPMRNLLIGESPFYLTQNLHDDLPIGTTVINMEGVKANAVVPLRRGDRVLGFLSVDNVKSGRPITEAQVRILLLFAGYAAAALYNAIVAEQTREHFAEIELRRRLERKVERLRQVHEVAAEITSLELESVLRITRDRTVEIFGFDRAGLLMFDTRDPEYLKRTWGTDDAGHLADERGAVYRLDDFPDLSEIVRTDQRYILTGHRDPGADEKPTHILIQLRGADQLLGVFSVDNNLTDRPITEEDVEVLLLLAEHASLAIVKAHIFALEKDVNTRLRRVLVRETKIASTLQKAFKPTVSSRMHGYRITHLYRPAMSESDLGGDFYDVLDLGNERLGLVMADVSGKGLAAAVRAARTRFALQAYALEDLDPVSVLRRLNRVLSSPPVQDGAFVTLFYGVLNAKEGVIDCASAGHEPPALLHADGQLEFIDITGLPCGVLPDFACSRTRIRLEPGDRFLLYSDGVTEARQGRNLFDFDGLRSALIEESAHPTDSLLRRLYGRVLRYSGGVMRDDVAFLLIESPGGD